MILGNNIKNLEKKIEKRIIESYSQSEYIRCYNLMRLMAKVNKENNTLMHYVDKLDDKKIENYRREWVLGRSTGFVGFIKSPKLYISLFLLYVFGKVK